MAGGKRGQAYESLQNGTSPASLCLPACGFSSPSLSIAHTHVYHIHRYILYTISIYIYIHTHVHICRVHRQAQKPRSCTAVGDPEESRPYFWAALLGAGRKLAIAREGRAGWESRGDSARPAQLSALQSSLPPPQKKENTWFARCRGAHL